MVLEYGSRQYVECTSAIPALEADESCTGLPVTHEVPAAAVTATLWRIGIQHGNLFRCILHLVVLDIVCVLVGNIYE